MDDISGSPYLPVDPNAQPSPPPAPVPASAPPVNTGVDPRTAFVAQRYGLTPQQMQSTAITPTYQDRIDAANANRPAYNLPSSVAPQQEQQPEQPFLAQYPFHQHLLDKYNAAKVYNESAKHPADMSPSEYRDAVDSYMGADGPVRRMVIQHFQNLQKGGRLPAGSTLKENVDMAMEALTQQVKQELPANIKNMQDYFNSQRPKPADAAPPPPRGFLDEIGHSLQDIDTGLVGGAARGVGGLALAGGGLASMAENLTGAPPGILSDKLFAGTQALNKYANNLPKPESTFGQILQGAGALVPGVLTAGAGAGASAADTLEKTGDLKRAEIENAVGGVTNLAGAPLGVAGGANPLTRAVVQGAGNVGAYELGRRLENAGLPEDQQRPFDPVEAGLSGGVGALFGGLSRGTFADELRRFRGSPNAQTPPASGSNTEGAGARPNGSFTPDNTPLGTSPTKAANDAAVRAASVVSSARDNLKARMGIAPGSPVEKPFDAETDRLITEAGVKARAGAAAPSQPAPGEAPTEAPTDVPATAPKPLDINALQTHFDDSGLVSPAGKGEGATPQAQWDSTPVQQEVDGILGKLGPLSPEDTATALNRIKADWSELHGVDPDKVTVKAPDTTGEDDLARAAGGEPVVPDQAAEPPKPVAPAPVDPIRAAAARVAEAKAQVAEAQAKIAKSRADAEENKVKKAAAAAAAKEEAARAEAAREEADKAAEEAKPAEPPPVEPPKPFSPADLKPEGPTTPLSAKPAPKPVEPPKPPFSLDQLHGPSIGETALAEPVTTQRLSASGRAMKGRLPVSFVNPDDKLAYLWKTLGAHPSAREGIERELIGRGYSTEQIPAYAESVSKRVTDASKDPLRTHVVLSNGAPAKEAGTPVTKKGSSVKYATTGTDKYGQKLPAVDPYKVKVPAKVMDEPIRTPEGEHEDRNRAYTGNLIKPRHALDEVMLKLRAWDRDNPDESLKMQWLQKHVFPGDTPEEIYTRVRGVKDKSGKTVVPSLWSAITAHARDTELGSAAPQTKAKVEDAAQHRPFSYRTGETGASSVDDVKNAVNGIGKGSRHIDVTNSHEQPAHAEPIGKGEQPVGYYDKANGRITLFADRIGSPAEARWTAWHELVHRGIDVEHGNAYGKALEDLEKNNGVKDLAKVIAERRGYDMEQLGQRHDAIEEAAAEIGAADAENNFGALKDRYGVDVQAKALDGITWRKPFEALKKIWQHITGMSHDDVLDFVRQAREAGSSNRPSTIWGRAESQAHLTEPPKYATRSPEDQARMDRLKAQLKASATGTAPPARPQRSPEDQARMERLKARLAGGENTANDSPAKLTRKSESIQKIIKESRQPGKVVKGLRAWAYMSMLTHLRTLPKIFATSTGELGIRPLEEIFGGALSKIMPDSIVNQAERYGHGLSAKGARAAIENLFNGEAYKEMLMKGTTYMDRMFDDLVARHQAELDANPELKKHVLEVIKNFQTGLHERPGLMNLPGRVHGLLHAPPMLAEHAYSLVKRQENFVRRLKAQGMSDRDAMVASSHPLAQLDMQIGAYKDALSAAYRGDNAVMRMYNGLSELLHERGGGMGPTIANVLDIMNPFMRVSSNLFSRGTDFLAGGAKAAGEIHNANKRIAESKALKKAGLGTVKDSDLTYTPAEADYIMRTLRAQGVGAAALLMGTLAWKAMGGLYQKDEYFRKDKPEQGTMKIGNTTIPKIYMEHPLLQIMQMGAMVARGAHEKGTDRAIGNAKEAGLDLADVLSFSRNTGDISKALESGDNALRFATQQVMNRAVPGVIPDTAHIQDLHDTQDHDWMKSFINYTFGDQTVHRIVRKEKGDTLAAAKNYAKSQLPKTPLNPQFNRQSLPKRD